MMFIVYGKTWNEFYDDGLAKPGTKLKVGGVLYLVGHINALGGTCDDCPEFHRDAIVESYAEAVDCSGDEWDEII